MVCVVLAPQMRDHTDGRVELEIAATNYRVAVRELQAQFPGLDDELFAKCSVAIDGVQVQTPLLETFDEDSELVFIPKISGG